MSQVSASSIIRQSVVVTFQAAETEGGQKGKNDQCPMYSVLDCAFEETMTKLWILV